EQRNLADIIALLEQATFSDKIKLAATNIFTVLAQAEAKVHGKPVTEVHFHEVGAIDTIIDIVGTVIALDYLQIERLYVSPLQTGRGFVQCAHGLMPIPAPATAEILQNVPYYQGKLSKELVTPTGAALMAGLAVPASDIPCAFHSKKIGYGAGTWELPIPNVVRVHLGDMAVATEEQLYVVECNIDDLAGEVFPYVLERLLAVGALDAWLTPIIMKKGRPAHKLAALASESFLEVVRTVILTETSSLGLRYYPVARTILERTMTVAELPEGSIAVKIATYEGKIVHIAPEYEACKVAAVQSGQPLQAIMYAATKLVEEKLHV
ncbi:MAG: nickel pincer cofactor biosynthesis protein LarC, partial [Acidaminococcaceae bacterium]